MQIAVTNQKTKSIRSASFEAGVGSHGTRSATATATAAAANPTATTRTSTPLRTAASLLNPRTGRLLRTSVTNAYRSRPVRVFTNAYERRFQRSLRGYTADTGHERKARKGDPMGVGVSLILI